MGNCCSTAQPHDDRDLVEGELPDDGEHFPAALQHQRRKVSPLATDGDGLSQSNEPVSTGNSVTGEAHDSSARGSLSYPNSLVGTLEFDDERHVSPRTPGRGGGGAMHASPTSSASDLLPLPQHRKKTVAATIAAANPFKSPHRQRERSFPPKFPMPQFDDLSDLDSIDPAYAEKLTERVRKIPALSPTERHFVIEAWMQDCSGIDTDRYDPSPPVVW